MTFPSPLMALFPSSFPPQLCWNKANCACHLALFMFTMKKKARFSYYTGERTSGNLSSIPSYVICLLGDCREITSLFCASACSARNIGLTFVAAQQPLSFHNDICQTLAASAQLCLKTVSCSPLAEPVSTFQFPV